MCPEMNKISNSKQLNVDLYGNDIYGLEKVINKLEDNNNL